MRKIHKSLLATAIAAVMAPSAFAIEAGMPEIHGSLDLTAAYKRADESALAIDSSPGDSSWLGINGEVKLDNGDYLTYMHKEIVDLDAGGFAGSYESYLGYRTDSFEVRAGNLHLPTRTVMEKADVFSGTYADANNVFLQNTIANNAIKYLGSHENLTYAVSIDSSIEDANNPNAMDGVRLSGMVDYRADVFSVAGGLDLTDAYMSFGLTADFALNENSAIVAGLELVDIDGGASPKALLVGAYMGIGEKGKAKAQLGYRDPDTAADAGTFLAVGYDHSLAEKVTAYALFSVGVDNGMTFSEVDTDGDNMVLATGIRVAF